MPWEKLNFPEKGIFIAAQIHSLPLKDTDQYRNMHKNNRKKLNKRKPRPAENPLKPLLILSLIAVLTAVCIFCAYSPVYGDDTDELEDQLEEAKEESSQLEDEIENLNDELSSLSESIEDLAGQISEKEEEIAALEEEISLAEEALTQSEALAQEQYESLCAWIKVSYENDFDSLIMTVVSAESLSDVLSQYEYVQNIYEFETNILTRYNSTIEELEEQKAELEAQYADLNNTLTALKDLEDETSEKKAEVTATISDTQDNLDDVEDEIDDLEAKIAEQKIYEAELEAQKALENVANYLEILEQEATNTGEAVVSTDASDLVLLAALIYCEAGGESYEGQLAVGCVVMNRVRSSSFPNTVSGVIYQSGQFSPVASGRLATVLANDMVSDSCYEAAAYVLAGNLPYPDFLYFRSASSDLTGITTTVIGNHQFF